MVCEAMSMMGGIARKGLEIHIRSREDRVIDTVAPRQLGAIGLRVQVTQSGERLSEQSRAAAVSDDIDMLGLRRAEELDQSLDVWDVPLSTWAIRQIVPEILARWPRNRDHCTAPKVG